MAITTEVCQCTVCGGASHGKWYEWLREGALLRPFQPGDRVIYQPTPDCSSTEHDLPEMAGARAIVEPSLDWHSRYQDPPDGHGIRIRFEQGGTADVRADDLVPAR